MPTSDKPSAWAMERSMTALGYVNLTPAQLSPQEYDDVIYVAHALDTARRESIDDERRRIILAVEEAIGRGICDGGQYRADIRSAIGVALADAEAKGEAKGRGEMREEAENVLQERLRMVRRLMEKMTDEDGDVSNPEAMRAAERREDLYARVLDAIRALPTAPTDPRAAGEEKPDAPR